MSNLYLVFSRKPEWVSRADYHAWYVDHAQENIESAGFLERPALRRARGSERAGRGEEQHLCAYQYEGDMSTWRDDLTRRIEAGDIVLKDWHHDIAFRSWDCQPTGDLLRTTRG